MRRILFVLILLTAASAASVEAAPVGSTLVRVTYESRNEPVEGSDGAVASYRLSFPVPASWRSVGRAARPTSWRLDSGGCRYRIVPAVRFAAGPRTGDAATASAVVLDALPETGLRLLGTGTRDRSAWRVTRPASPGVTTVAGDLARPWRPAGSGTWLHLTLRATAPGRCHSGSYRGALGPQIGDALAAARFG